MSSAEVKKTQDLSVIQKILKESQAYTSLELIESNIEGGGDLTHFPIQPLYTVLKQLPAEKAGALLERLSPHQRQSFLDLDLWERDDLDVESFEYWIRAYASCPEEKLQEEFVLSSEFSLFLKGRFNIWTFDEEDPLYPDHDCYFLTDDSLLLFEFDEDFEYMAEVRELVKRLYASMGVEKAYSYLFKLTVDSFMSFQEEEYQRKKHRLAELGFVDYFDALEIESCYNHPDLLESGMKKAFHRKTANIDNLGKQQALHSKSLVAFREDSDLFSSELAKVQSEKRHEYLRFNFIRMVNASMVFHEALKAGQMALTRVGKNTRALMTLGFELAQKRREEGELPLSKEESLFDYFDFVDIYRFGHSLVEFVQKDIQKGLKATHFEGDEHIGFLGRHLGEILDFSFEKPPRVLLPESEGKASDVQDLESYQEWKKQARLLVEILPFSDKFFVVFKDLTSEGKLSDSFYFNYTVNEIDLEAILLSSFANFTLDQAQQRKQTQNKMGLTVAEFKAFATRFFDAQGHLIENEEFHSSLKEFIETYGLKEVFRIEEYFVQILKDHLEGYDFSALSENDYKHVGGPIILDPGQ